MSIAAAKRAVLEGASASLPDGLALERKWFLAALSRPAARRAMRRYADDVQRSGVAPWEDASTRDAWREGSVVDLHGDDAS